MMSLQFDTTRLPVDAGSQWTSVARAGLSVGLLLSGGVDFRLAEQSYQRFEGPLGFLWSSDDELPVDHRAIGGGQLTCVYLHLPADVIEARIGQNDQDGVWACDLLGGMSGAHCRYWRSSPAAAALGLDIQHCPFAGVSRQLYVQAKGYEFLARAIDGLFDPSSSAGRSHPGLTASDVERLHAARDILAEEYADPPNLDTLGHRVGLSVTRLTSGFRRLFSTSVVGFLQTYRLQIAYDGLSAGRMTVAQAAHAAGYRPSSFSTLFLKRYGVAPNVLRRRHL